MLKGFYSPKNFINQKLFTESTCHFPAMHNKVKPLLQAAFPSLIQLSFARKCNNHTVNSSLIIIFILTKAFYFVNDAFLHSLFSI